MLNKIRNASQYNKNILTLFTGSVISQAIPIIISPILTRLYSPEDFGVYGIFVAVTSILTILINGSYEQAIVLPKTEEETFNLIGLSFLINLIISIVTLIGVTVVYFLTENSGIKQILFFIPFFLFLSGIFNIINYYNIRLKNFKELSKVIVLKNLITAFFQLSIGFLKPNAIGIVSGLTISNLFSNGRLFKKLEFKSKLHLISRQKMKDVGLRYISFLKFQTPISFINIFSSNLPVFYFTKYFGNATTGFLTFTNRLLLMPTTIIGSSIGQVFLSECSETYKSKPDQMFKLVESTFSKLALVGVFSYTFVFFWADKIFPIVFGEKWLQAGEFAEILSISLVFMFISAPLSNIFIVYEKQKQGLFFYLVLFFLRIITLMVCFNLTSDSSTVLWCFTIVNALHYICFIYYMFRITKTPLIKSIGQISLYLIICTIVFGIPKLFF